MRHTRLLAIAGAAALGAAALGACAGDGPTTPDVPLTFARVVLVSVDGLRADALAHMPTLVSLRDRAVWTDSMQTVVPSLTLPGHLSMLTGRDVTQFGVTTNELTQSNAAALLGAGVTPVFYWVRDAGKRSLGIAGVSFIPPDRLSRTQQVLGVDSLIATDLEANAVLTRAAASAAGSTPPALLFAHVADADLAGHAHGWIVPGTENDNQPQLTPAYRAAVARVDSAIAVLWRAVQPAVDSGRVAFIVTADHGGGHGAGCTQDVPAHREHCTAHPGDRTIPFVLLGRGVDARRVAGTTRITQVAPTVARLLGIRAVAGVDDAIAF